MVGPSIKIPMSSDFQGPEEYIESLLSFATSSLILQTFSGNVHILDFLTRAPDLYSSILPADWREWFDQHDIQRILNLLLREDLSHFHTDEGAQGGGSPPATLLEFISNVRRHSLVAQFTPAPTAPTKIPIRKTLLAGMNEKKQHEVQHFSQYIAALVDQVSASTGTTVTHIVDFGSGCNYLGRYLAAVHGKTIIAVESRAHVVHGAKKLDAQAGLAREAGVRRNKKTFIKMGGRKGILEKLEAGEDCPECVIPINTDLQKSYGNAIQYVEHRIENGDLKSVFDQVAIPRSVPAYFMVISLHSCGNLIHHGLKTIKLNPSVSAVAMVGCCYNLMTESLGPPTLKLPGLRTLTPRLLWQADPHGFPISQRLQSYSHSDPVTNTPTLGVRLNVTARMMAVQAATNWTEAHSARFFTRHFYRALLQRLLLDLGLVPDPSPAPPAGRSPAGTGSAAAAPLVIGSLANSCYADFATYVRGAAAKLARSEESREVAERLRDVSVETLEDYEKRFGQRKKHLSVTWSLMAFCAQISEAIILCDRYAWLTEQKDEVGDSWVESVFDYGMSPRNMAVVGIRKNI